MKDAIQALALRLPDGEYELSLSNSDGEQIIVKFTVTYGHYDEQFSQQWKGLLS